MANLSTTSPVSLLVLPLPLPGIRPFPSSETRRFVATGTDINCLQRPLVDYGALGLDEGEPEVEFEREGLQEKR